MLELQKIVNAYSSINWEEEQAALAMVIRIEESSYRRIGARMLVTSKGTWIGGISGGCLEGDALKKAQKAIQFQKPSLVVYDTMDDDSNEIGIGLGCNGRIEVLFLPIDPRSADNPIELLTKIINTREPLYIKHRIKQNGVIDYHATISKVPRLDSGGEHRSHYVIENNVEFLYEIIKPAIHCIIVGDNYDIYPMIAMAKVLGWKITLVGSKRKLRQKQLLKDVQTVEYAKFGSIAIDNYTAVILISHDFKKDREVLIDTLQKNDWKYLGILGPLKRFEKLKNSLSSNSALERRSDHIFAPIGLDLGANTPEEIALSICAEILKVFYSRNGNSLKYRQQSIHDRH